MNLYLIRLALVVVTASAAFAGQFAVKFDDPTHSVFHGTPKFRSGVERDFVFNLSDPAWQVGQPVGGYVDYAEATNSSPPLNGVLGGYDCSISWSSNRLNNSYITQTCPPREPGGDPHTENAYAFPMSWTFFSQLCISQQSDIAADFHDRVAAFGTDGVDYTFSPVSIACTFRGGPFDSTKTKIKGMVAMGVTGARFNGAHDDNWSAVGDMFVQIDWGTDPWGGHEYYLFQISMNAYASTSDMDCIPLASAYSQMLGTDPENYLRGIQQDLQSQLQSGAARIEGATPELLYLYDFSGKYTVPPLTTIPQQALILFDFDGYTNFPGFVNQYDAGVAFNLPVRFSRPNPVVNGCTPGGNACGPTSLMMAMNAFRQDSVTDEKPVFANATSAGLHYGTCSDRNGFDAGRAQNWLLGTNTWKRQPVDPAPPFTATTGILFASSLQGTNAIDRGWDLIDQMLLAKKPVVFRSDLGVGVDPGGGHMILLLGKGHSDEIASVWSAAFPNDNISGDYYIVADPAGHQFSDPAHTHYDLVDKLREKGKGVCYGGWFAIYPAELLRPRTSDNFTQEIRDETGAPIQTNSVPYNRLTVLTIGQMFGRRLWFEVHSPVTIMVTDAAGRRTGIQTDGAYVTEISASVYMPDISDEEDEGTSQIDPDGPQSVFIDDPPAGTYQVQLVGTGTGEFTFDWHELAADGSETSRGVFSGTTTPGQIHNYTVQIGAADMTSPPLRASLASGSLVLSWPTNFVGFSLEAATDIATPTSWQSVGANMTVVDGQNTTSIPIGAGRQFFRLKQ